jgi:ABC-type glycerol-3-phosphate transport system substrate-binding protein
MHMMRLWLSALLVAVLLCACGSSGAQQPTREDVEKAMRAYWEKSGDNFAPRSTVEFNEIKFGSTNVANEQDVINGIPPGGAVTAAIVDFTVRTYYTDKTKADRRKREAAVYLDKFGEWAVMTGQVRGEDSSTEEPPQK